MGGHGHEPYKVPHPSIYKIDNIPQLKEVKEALGRVGLKDPWLRNEAWRYDPKTMGTHLSRARVFFLRGMGWGAALAAITIGVEYSLGIGGYAPHPHHGDEEGHGHGHGAHH